MKIGLSNFPTDTSIRAVPLARAAEERGFESLFVVEHTHIPASRRTPYPMGGDLPSIYWESYEPFTFLAQAAAVTERLKVGTGICLVPEHHPLALAKRVASLDSLSNGRFLFGIGAGWNAEELENHGVAFEDRWKVLREHILAMKACWTDKAAEYHGTYVDFDPVWVEPKPVSRPHPPILIGASSKWAIERIVEYADGWLPIMMPDFDERLAQLRQLCEAHDRDPASIDITVFGMPDKGLIEQLHSKGINRVVFGLETQPEAESLTWLDEQVEIVEWAQGLG
jgi:probable F420-dependent oxidoreductase